ncbi:T9SS type A sorting domain-containing protein [Formosa maritima]|uniref:T9SS type A sorting domain-containing protein n=2 Tax=Formosa maritima TaxID=2592046 RepID=A0A5D0GBJ0_9FLAO|nr:T9SS type A sorting domain-containing protein [Formosa maritima]
MTFDCSDVGGDLDSLIISEYVDGTQNDCIEIYNGTGNPVNMIADNYRLRIYANGASSATYDITLSGIIPNDDVYVICFNSLGVNSAIIDQYSGFEFNGNDAIALVKSGNAVDVIGVIGTDPGTGWSSGGVSTNGTTLIRNVDVLQANINAFVANLATEWSQFPQDTYGHLGTHDIEITDLANNVILTVTDIHGNVSTCEGNVTVIDATPPVAFCQNITVALLEDGTVSVDPSQIDNGSMDACGIATLQLDVTDFNCSHIGVNPVVLTVTDVNGNSATCNATVTIIDTTPPVVATQDITVQLGGDGTVSISPEDVNNNTMDVCSAVTLEVSPNTFDCDNIGENTVTLTATDIYGNSSSATAIVTVEDVYDPTAVCNAIFVYLEADGTYTLSNSDIEAIADGSFDNCDDDLEFTVTPMNFSCDNRGANTVTLTVTDNYGNSDTCTATVTVGGSFIEDIVISASELPEFCQGAAIVLTANAVVSAGSIDNTVTYLWDTNETTQSIEVTANGTYGVLVTSSTNCSEYMEIDITDFDAGSLVAAYTILAENEVYLHGSNLVQSGGVGSMNPTNGNVKLHQATTVSGFVQSVSLDLNQGSTVGSWNQTAANPTIPQFVYNTQSNNSSPSVTINNNQTQTLNGSVYKTITVKQGATVYFSQSNVYINELKTFEGASIEFNTCANVFINEKFMLAQGGTINADDSNKVIFFVNEDVQIEKGSDVRASIHANTHELMVKGDNANGNQVAQPTYMRGLFIANKVHGNKNVIWNADDLCDPCPISAPATGGNEHVSENTRLQFNIEVEAWPNPSDTDFKLRLKTDNLSDKAEINVFDMNNRLVHKSNFQPENVYKFGNEFDGGVYLVKVSQAGKHVYTRVVKF